MAFLSRFVFDNVATPNSLGTKTPEQCFDEAGVLAGTASGSLCFFPQLNWLVSWEAILGGHITYALLIYAMRQAMKNRGEVGGLKYPMLFYNFIQIVLSSLMVIGMLPYFLQFPNFFNINGLFSADIEFWVLVHFLAKFLDMFDTVFIVLRKKDKQFSFLHVYHHTTIGIIWGFLLHYGAGNGAAYWGAWINSLVHALMYSHYFFSSLGFDNPLKTYLTKFQMFQFALCILQAIIVTVVPNNFPRSLAALQMVYHPTLLYLFYDYLQGEIAAKKKAAKLAASPSSTGKEKSVEPSTPTQSLEGVAKKSATPKARRSASKGKKN
jgi:hypothetical protein